jgi:hypothetical protein
MKHNRVFSVRLGSGVWAQREGEGWNLNYAQGGRAERESRSVDGLQS